jgi:transposase
VIGQGLPIYGALQPVDMWLGYERLGGMMRERMQAEPRSKALFVFVGKRGPTMKVLTWDGTGAIVMHKKLDAGKFELRKSTRVEDQHVIVSDAIFELIYKGVSTAPKKPRKHIPSGSIKSRTSSDLYLDCGARPCISAVKLFTAEEGSNAVSARRMHSTLPSPLSMLRQRNK